MGFSVSALAHLAIALFGAISGSGARRRRRSACRVSAAEQCVPHETFAASIHRLRRKRRAPQLGRLQAHPEAHPRFTPAACWTLLCRPPPPAQFHVKHCGGWRPRMPKLLHLMSWAPLPQSSDDQSPEVRALEPGALDGTGRRAADSRLRTGFTPRSLTDA